MRKLTTEEFIERSKKVHGDRYDYSSTIYIDMNKKVIIVCHKHGPFMQTAIRHIHGSGCKKCAMETLHTGNFQGVQGFIDNIHPDYKSKYDLSQLVYKGQKYKVTVICPKHGPWQASPKHIPTKNTTVMNGANCPECARDRQRSTTEEFITKAKAMKKPFISFEKVSYINNHTKVCFTCAKHGDFWTRPNDYLNDCGCPSCHMSAGESKLEEILKKYDLEYKRQVRIPECKYKRVLPFDFGIYENGKLKMLIEYQGEQHYRPFPEWGGEKALKQVQHRDKIKREYCLKKKIPLIEINYEMFWKMEKELLSYVYPSNEK